MVMLMRPPTDPSADRLDVLAHRLAFARRLSGSRYPFDDAHHRLLILEETRRGHDSAGPRLQIAAMAVAGDRRARLVTITAPTFVVHGMEDPLFPPAFGRDTGPSILQAALMMLDGVGHEVPPALDRTIAAAIGRTNRRASYG